MGKKADAKRAEQKRAVRRRGLVASGVSAVLSLGSGYLMYLSWGVWGVFVAWSVVTLIAVIWSLGFLRWHWSWSMWGVLCGVAFSCLWLMEIGWGLVALANPDYVIGWHLPSRTSDGLRIRDEADAHSAAVQLLSTGVFLTAGTFLFTVFMARGEVSLEKILSRPNPGPSGHPAMKNAHRRMDSRRLEDRRVR